MASGDVYFLSASPACEDGPELLDLAPLGPLGLAALGKGPEHLPLLAGTDTGAEGLGRAAAACELVAHVPPPDEDLTVWGKEQIT